MPSHCPCEHSFTYYLDDHKCSEEEIVEINGILKYLQKKPLTQVKSKEVYERCYSSIGNPDAEELADQLFKKHKQQADKKDEEERHREIVKLQKKYKMVSKRLKELEKA